MAVTTQTRVCGESLSQNLSRNNCHSSHGGDHPADGQVVKGGEEGERGTDTCIIHENIFDICHWHTVGCYPEDVDLKVSRSLGL